MIIGEENTTQSKVTVKSLQQHCVCTRLNTHTPCLAADTHVSHRMVLVASQRQCSLFIHPSLPAIESLFNINSPGDTVTTSKLHNGSKLNRPKTIIVNSLLAQQ